PPENELQKCHENNPVLSEHQLRVQASLQRLNIPEWYRKYGPPSKPTEPTQSGYVPGSFTKKRNSDVGRWTGLNSKTTSLSSLGSNRTDRSPLLLSPSAHSHHGQTGFSRWSTSHLNSSLTSPSASTRGSFSRGGVLTSSTLSGTSAYSARSSIRQPYLGWRSQEKLDNPRTPGERLAARHSEHLIGKQLAKQRKQNEQQEPAVTPEIQSSIKEVTSAIVHFVNDQADRASRSRSTSPTTRKCWLESSFVGNRPLDSPQTPVIDTFSPRSSADATLSRLNGVATPIPVLSVHSSDQPSPSSTTLEDVLASLLGLPTDSYRSSDTALANDTTESKTHLQIETVQPRRRSEGDAQKRVDSTNSLRRGSLDSTEFKIDNELVKCRFPKCDSSTTAAEAKKYYKSCHNCSHMYCSRECRRSHWEKHRKACLHSRVSALCRQVLSACKDDADTLRHLSLLARKGYVSQGRGVIRILFRSPESAEAFVAKGFQCIGEASYVRWAELLPQEMGAELYSELLRLTQFGEMSRSDDITHTYEKYELCDI
ncbi:Apical junction component 1 like, partial [Pseudolycoriella hygida]